MEEKKIAIKHYLNKRVAPTIHRGEEYYPLYTQVTYNRKNTQFKMNLRDHLFTDELLEVLLDPKTNIEEDKSSNSYLIYEYFRNTIKWNEHIIKSIIRFELSFPKKKFSLKGFGKRFMHFEQDLCEMVRAKLYEMVFSELEALLDFNQFVTVKNMGFVKAYDYLKTSFPTIIQKLSESTIALIPLYNLISFVGMKSQTPIYRKMEEELNPFITKKLKDKHGISLEEGPSMGIYFPCSVFEWVFNDAEDIFLEILTDFSNYFQDKMTMREVMEKHGFSPPITPIEEDITPKEEDSELYLSFINSIIYVD